ncbi:MAG TPA: Gfo/Idh/MocA family oxidoreductase [Rhizomicrobium sp.]|jgi:predicted dehydrogenase|nr:Gfo/Idh/MocA family oxidoreductase [Rhizomicrobium sp.]
MKRFRGVAVGTGYFSQYHFDAWRRCEGAEITAIAGLDAAQAQATAARYGIARVYGDVAEMLGREKPDFIDIITPPATHNALVTLAAEHGVNILCQKALAPTLEEARGLVEIAARADVRLMVHDNFRFQPWHRETRRLLDLGIIGALQSISCRTRLGDGWGQDAYLTRQPYFRDMPQFLVFETGVHFIDVYRYLGGEIVSVFARLRRLNPAIKGEDCGVVLFDFASGASGSWDADRYHESLAADPRYTFGEFLLEGERGALRIDSQGGIELHLLGSAPVQHDYAPSRYGFAGDSVAATFAHFIARLADGAPFETSGADYLRTLAVQDAVYASAASGVLERV